jgi:hypothetical protein
MSTISVSWMTSHVRKKHRILFKPSISRTVIVPLTTSDQWNCYNLLYGSVITSSVWFHYLATQTCMWNVTLILLQLQTLNIKYLPLNFCINCCFTTSTHDYKKRQIIIIQTSNFYLSLSPAVLTTDFGSWHNHYKTSTTVNPYRASLPRR